MNVQSNRACCQAPSSPAAFSRGKLRIHSYRGPRRQASQPARWIDHHDMSDPSESTANPVTVAVGFQVKPGRLLDFERWAHDITAVASGFPGNQGASWVRTGGGHHLVYRFPTHSLFHACHDSPEP